MVITIITDIIHKHIQALIHINIIHILTHTHNHNIILTHIIMGLGIHQILGHRVEIIIVTDTIIMDIITTTVVALAIDNLKQKIQRVATSWPLFVFSTTPPS